MGMYDYKEIVKQNFSRCAPYYDRYSNIQNLCATRLIAKIKTNNFASILELGCGTGNFTRLLREKFPGAKIKAVDMSKEMIKQAKGKSHQDSIDFIVADAEKINFEDRFGLISSNASLQWFTNLESTLAKYKNLLDGNGLIFFSLFGPGTFSELNECIRELLGKGASINSCNFIERKKIEKILKGIFAQVEIEDKIYQERHHSLAKLLKKIKYTGVRGGACRKRSFWTAKMLDDLERIYKERFKEIIATYEVIFCKAVK